jgi:hypothetical protein
MNKRYAVLALLAAFIMLFLAGCTASGGSEEEAVTEGEAVANGNDNEEILDNGDDDGATNSTADDEVDADDVGNNDNDINTNVDANDNGANANEDDKDVDEDDLESQTLAGGYIWQRVGGIAGFCDVVTVPFGGTATIADCGSDPPAIRGEVILTAEQAQQVSNWVERLASFEHEQKDPATADAMTITLIFEGDGDDEATAEDIAAMEALAMDLLAQGGSAPTQ